MSTMPVPIESIDALYQIRDELRVVWCALTNPVHGEECVGQIAEHVNGIHLRIVALLDAAEQHPEPVRMVGGERGA